MKSKNFLKNIMFIFIIVFISFCYSNFICIVHGDEIWSYGFSYNIASGLVPYRDFNVIVTPFYFFVNSLLIKIFGNYLLILHIFDAFLIGIIIWMLFKIIGYKSLIVYPFIIFFCPPSYNLLCVFFLFLLLYLINQDKYDNELIGFIIGIVFLTKQTVGIVFFIISFFNSKNKLKFFSSFLLPIFLFVIYLVWYGALYQFIDYCFLGMFDFQKENKTFNFFILLELLSLIYLSTCLIKSKFSNKEIWYILGFQIMIYPIFDLYHFLLAFSPVVYYFVKSNDNLYFLSVMFLIVFFSFINLIDFSHITVCLDKNYLFLRNVHNIKKMNLDEQVEIISRNKDNYDYQFFMVYNAYLLKLYGNIEINKFDLLNNGNMGYKGSSKFEKEIHNMCMVKRCVFYVDEDIITNRETQFNKEILNYVINTYDKVDSFEYFDVYSN